MGSYGIGLGRLMGTVVEVLSDEKGLVWPASIAPFQVHLLEISSDDTKVKKTAEKLYGDLVKAGVEVLYDDRELRAGEKFADGDLIGIPLRIIVSEKGIEKKEFEIKERANGKISMLAENEILKFIQNYVQ
jgi:prolyl-tRNA synthetase